MLDVRKGGLRFLKSALADEEIAEQVLETSTDGRNFVPLARLSKTERSYSYRPNTSGSIAYRLDVKFVNNAFHYSNIVTIKQPVDNARPKLISSFITTNAITVTSPGRFDYSILDMNGKLLKKGLLVTGMNTIAADKMISGIYLIHFSDGSAQWTEKLVKK